MKIIWPGIARTDGVMIGKQGKCPGLLPNIPLRGVRSTHTEREIRTQSNPEGRGNCRTTAQPCTEMQEWIRGIPDGGNPTFHKMSISESCVGPQPAIQTQYSREQVKQDRGFRK